MSCPFSHLAAPHDNNRTGGAAVALHPASSCPFSGLSQTTTANRVPQPEQHVNDQKLCPIPQPPTRWLTGNLAELTPSFPMQSLWRLADAYGHIYQLDLVTETVVVVSSHELIRECLDPARFDKVISGGVAEVRDLLGDGLFSAQSQEKVCNLMPFSTFLLGLFCSQQNRIGVWPTES